MDLNNIEKNLSNLGKEHKVEVDTKALWSGVSNELDRKKKRPKFIWIIAGAIIGFAFLLGLGIFSISEEGQEDKIENLILNQTSQLENKDEEEFQLGEAHESINEEENQQKINQPDGGALYNSEEPIINSEGRTKISNNKVEINTPTEYDTLLLNEPPRTRTPILLNETETSGLGSYKVASLPLVNETIDPLLKNKVDKGSEGVNGVRLENENQKKERVDLESKGDILRRPFDYALNPVDASITPLEAIIFSALLPQRSLIQLRSSSPWRIGVYGGLLFNSMSLTGVSIDGGVTESSSLLKRQSSASPLISWEFDVEMGYRIAPHFYLVSGLQFRNMSSRSSSELVTTTDYLQDGIVVERVIGPDGIEEIIGRGMVTEETRSLRMRISNYKILSIPLYMEYVSAGSLFNTFIGVGVDNSIVLNRSGLIHLNEEEEYDIDMDSDELFSNKLGLSMNVYGGLRFRMLGDIYLSTRVGFRKELFSHFKTQSTISEKYSTVRLQLGIEHQF